MSFKYSVQLVLVLLLSAGSLQAQETAPKYGHMNLGNLLEELPATASANSALKVIADSLGVVGDTMAAQFQREYAKVEKDYNAGNLTPIAVQQAEIALKAKQDSIVQFEQQAQQMLAGKRDELLGPILTDIQNAIEAVAKENGYLMIFDVSSGVMLFADETEDVSALVKKKLGITDGN
ncbi:MAG: OmpH family outer membrane protein [Saprospiraceae bacterium]|jgi:outer membrane protein